MILIQFNLTLLGHWCIFKRITSEFSIESLSEQNVMKNCIFGNIVAFKYAIGDSSTKSKPYTLDFAPISSKENNQNLETTDVKSIHALATV